MLTAMNEAMCSKCLVTEPCVMSFMRLLPLVATRSGGVGDESAKGESKPSSPTEQTPAHESPTTLSAQSPNSTVKKASATLTTQINDADDAQRPRRARAALAARKKIRPIATRTAATT